MQPDSTTVLRYGSYALCLPFAAFHGRQDLDSNRILVCNCMTLMAYLGLSTAHLASGGWKADGEESSESLPSVSESGHVPQSSSLDSSNTPPNASYDILPSQPETFEMRAMATTSAPAFLPTMSSSSMGSYASTELMNNTNSPDRAITTTTSPSTQKRCPTCGKWFSSVANRNKHIRFDCKYASTERFPCRNAGCRRRFREPSFRGDPSGQPPRGGGGSQQVGVSGGGARRTAGRLGLAWGLQRLTQRRAPPAEAAEAHPQDSSSIVMGQDIWCSRPRSGADWARRRAR